MIKSILLMIISALGFAIVQSIAKFLGPTVSPWAKALYRSLIGLIFLLLYFFIYRKKIVLKNVPILFIRGFTGALSLIFVFWTIDIYDLSHATLYLYTYPIFAPLFSSVFYKEKFHAIYLIPIILSISGVYFIADPTGFSFSYKDIIGLSSGILAGIAISSLKHLRKTDSPENIYLCFCLISSIVCFIGIIFKSDQYLSIPRSNDLPVYLIWILLISLGLFATAAQLSMTIAYKSLSTTVGTIISLLTLPVVTFIAIIFFKEAFPVYLIIGGILIFISALSVTLIKRYIIKT